MGVTKGTATCTRAERDGSQSARSLKKIGLLKGEPTCTRKAFFSLFSLSSSFTNPPRPPLFFFSFSFLLSRTLNPVPGLSFAFLSLFGSQLAPTPRGIFLVLHHHLPLIRSIMQVVDKKQDLRASPSARNLSSGPYGEKGNTYSQWPDTHPSFVPQCVKQENHSLDMGYDMNVKLNGHETGDFRQSVPLSESWNRFPPEESYALRPQFPSHKLSPSPDSSETATPPSATGSLHTTLHDSLPTPYTINSNSPAIDGFASSYARADTDNFVRPLGLMREEPWSKNFGGEYRVAPSYPSLGLGLNPVALPPVGMSSYDSTYSSYPSHSSSDINGHHHYNQSNLSGHLSPPPTASTSTSSGSSSPSLHGDFYEQRGSSKSSSSYQLGPNPYSSMPSSYHNPKHYACGNDWQTCDPRGMASSHHNLLPPLANHNHSPATSDSSCSADGKKPKIRPRRADSNHSGGYEMGLAKSMIIGPTPTVEMLYRVKKKVTSTPPQPVLGMGLEDIDENEIEFTSRQDTKPTRLLRRQCYNCKTWRDVSAWRRSVMAPGHIVCNKCGLYEKAHKRSRPLNDRGEFVRPGKDPNPKVPVLISPAGSKPATKNRSRSESDTPPAADVPPIDGASVMQFDTNNEKDESIKDA